MPFNISEFKSTGLSLGGARPSQFQVLITPPPALGVTSQANKIRMVVKSSQIPPMIIGQVSVGYFGRPVKFAGDREFPDWTVTVMNDEDYAVRAIMEKWSNEMNKLVSNVQGPGIWPVNYKTDAEVIHYGKNGEEIRSYKFVGIFPTTIDAMPLDWDATNQIQQFDVSFAYDYWVPSDQSGPSASPTGTTYDVTIASDGNGTQ